VRDIIVHLSKEEKAKDLVAIRGEIVELDMGPLGLGGGNTLCLPPRPHHLPPQMEHLEQLELPL
jgi:hypothetical protein